MTRREQITFIRRLSRAVTDRAIESTATMPPDFDGHELRTYIADLWGRERSRLVTDARTTRGRTYARWRAENG